MSVIPPTPPSPEELHRSTLQQDVEALAQSAQPSYHERFPHPRSMAILQNISLRGDRVIVDRLDYQVTKIEVKPLGILQTPGKEPDYGPQMAIIRKRQARRRVEVDHDDHSPPPKSGGKKAARHDSSDDDHDAFHNYVAKSTEGTYDPVVYSPKLEDADRATKDTQILTIDGVDYVWEGCLNNKADYRAVQGHLNLPPKASVDQWPEEIVIYDADAKGGSRTYLRADVLFFEADRKVDLRLLPQNAPSGK